MPKAAKAKKAPTKTEILNNIADATGLTRKQVQEVMEALQAEIKKNIGPRGPGVFTIPGLVKITRKKVPARPARKDVPVRDIRTGVVTIKDMPAKPASVKPTVRALKNLKDML